MQRQMIAGRLGGMPFVCTHSDDGAQRQWIAWMLAAPHVIAMGDSPSQAMAGLSPLLAQLRATLQRN